MFGFKTTLIVSTWSFKSFAVEGEGAAPTAIIEGKCALLMQPIKLSYSITQLTDDFLQHSLGTMLKIQ